MTWRRLYHWLLTGSTVVVAGLWTWSCWGLAHVSASNGFGYYTAEVWSGTVILQLYSPEVRQTEEEANAVPFPRHFFLPGLRDHNWRFRWTSSSGLSSRYYAYRRTGEFEVVKGLSPFAMGPHAQHYRSNFRLDLPLWMPWLVAVAGALAVTQWMEKRVGAGKEKKLAESAVTNG